MAIAGMSDAAVKEATGRDWAEWCSTLDADGAADMTHTQIARHLAQYGIGHWWRQMVTVGYERLIGRRAVGQRCDGDYSASASKTLPGSTDEAIARWRALVAERVEFAGAIAESEPRLSETAKWRYWKIDLDDGSRVSVNVCAKGEGKAILGINHDKLGDSDAAQRAKAFWKEMLAQV